MPRSQSLLASSLFAALMLATSTNAQSLTTLFTSNNGGGPGWGVFYDITVLNPAGLRITGFDVNCGEAANTPFTLDVYITPNTYVGNDTTPGVWIKIASGAGLTVGRDMPSPVDTSDFILGSGTFGVAIYYNSASPVYTNGTGSNQMYANNDASLQLGIVRSALWGGTLFTPRVWNGTIHYANRGTAAYGIYGSGCQGSNGVPKLAPAPNSLPKLNNSLVLNLTSMRTAGGAALVFLGTRKDQWMSLQLPFSLAGVGAPGCELLTSVVFIFAVANVNGSGSLTLPVPNDSALLGGLIYSQGLVLDPVNAFGGVMTNGGEGVIGT